VSAFPHGSAHSPVPTEGSTTPVTPGRVACRRRASIRPSSAPAVSSAAVRVMGERTASPIGVTRGSFHQITQVRSRSESGRTPSASGGALANTSMPRGPQVSKPKAEAGTVRVDSWLAPAARSGTSVVLSSRVAS